MYFANEARRWFFDTWNEIKKLFLTAWLISSIYNNPNTRVIMSHYSWMAAHCACRLLVNAMAIVSMTQATRLITTRERPLLEQCVTGTWGHVFSQFHFHLELVTLISLIDKVEWRIFGIVTNNQIFMCFWSSMDKKVYRIQYIIIYFQNHLLT